MAYVVKTLVNGNLEQNCYLLYDDARREAVVVDPGSDPQALRQAISAAGVKPVLILATHGHFDHVGAVQALKDAYGVPFGLSKADAELLEVLEDSFAYYGMGSTTKPGVDRWLLAGEVLQVGGMDLRVLGTPGHTLGGLCFYHPASGSLFSGDTLFSGSVGRSDFEGGSHPQLIDSIRRELWVLPPATKVYPGHGPASDIAEEKAHNRFLQA
jgi:glyoxylase-like metal-dependent hydrolase (beta-lactamase superfamily II)